MKSKWIAFWALATNLAAFGQGQVNFNTHIISDTPPIDARILNWDGTPWTGFGQLVIVNNNGSLTPLAPIGTFGTSASEAGYIDAGTATAPAGFPSGTTVNLVLRAWQGASGSTFDTATIKGQTSPVTATLTEPPDKPNDLVGLQGFMLVPEPTTFALSVLAVAAFALRRRR